MTGESEQRAGQAKSIPLRVAIRFVVIGFIAVFLAEILFDSQGAGPPGYQRALVEAGLYALVIGVSLYYLVKYYIQRIEASREELRHSEARYRTLFEGSPGAVVFLGLDGRVKEVNERYCDILRTSREDVIGKHFSELNMVLSDELEDKMELFESVSRGEPLGPLVLEARRGDGRGIWVEVYPKLLVEDGAPAGLMAVFQDITYRRLRHLEIEEQQGFLKRVIESSSEGIFVLDEQVNYVLLNPASGRITGLDPDEWIGKRAGGYIHEDDKEEALRAFLRARNGEHVVFDCKVARSDGSWASIRMKLSPLSWSGGGHILGLVEDITRQKRNEEITAIQRDLGLAFSALIDLDRALPLGLDAALRIGGMEAGSVYFLNRDGGLGLIHSAGFREDEDVFCRPPERFPPGSAMAEAALAGVPLYLNAGGEELAGLASGEGAGTESLVMLPLPHMGNVTGAVVLLSRRAVEFPSEVKDALETTAAQLAGVIGRIAAVSELRASEERYRLHFARGTDVIYFIDREYRVTSISPSVETHLGYKPEEIEGRNIAELGFIAPEYLDMAMRESERILSGEKVAETVYEFIAKDGRRVIASVSGIPLMKGDEISGVGAVARNITERILAERALAEEKERLAVTLASIGDAVISVNAMGRVVLANPVAAEMFGLDPESEYGPPLREILMGGMGMDKEAAEGAAETIVAATGRFTLPDAAVPRGDGGETVLNMRGAPVRDAGGQVMGAVLVLADVTERRRYQQDLMKREKLESLGILAGGIAHDFNNILTLILGNVSLARMCLPDEVDPAIESLEDTERACRRARDLTQQLLTFSKGGAPVKTLSSLKFLVEDSAKFMLRGSNVRLDCRIARDLWPAEVDEGQFSQVIQNLVINADQAMPGGGTLRIGAENIETEAGRFVRLKVADQGTGIPESLRTKIFDPFFTTKNKGSGLGLSTVYSIVKNHGGSIEVESEVEKGTAFTIMLPASNETIESLPAEKRELVSATGGRVLFMDDERELARTFKRMAESAGFTVVTVSDGRDAVDYYRDAMEEDMPFDIVVLDLTVPGGMGGKDAAKEILKTDPHARIIVSSGYSNDPVLGNHREYGFIAMIPKPYDGDTLRRVLAETMETKQEQT